MKKLTETNHWDEAWTRTILPVLIDTKIYGHWRKDRLLRKHLAKGNKKFLEVGCGTSEWLIYFSKFFDYEVYGIDISKKACEISRENLRIANVTGTIVHGNVLQRSAFEKESFDVIFSGGVIEHFDDPSEMIEAMVRLLKPGGCLITTIPSLCGINGFLWKWDKESFDMHQRISVDQLTGIYQRAGLRQINARYFGSFRIRLTEFFRSSRWPLFHLDTILNLFIKVLNKAVATLLRISRFEPESRLFSPEIIAIGSKQNLPPGDEGRNE